MMSEALKCILVCNALSIFRRAQVFHLGMQLLIMYDISGPPGTN